MDVRLLRSFVAVAEAGTVSRAATALMITQPALTRQIQQLERQTGVTLFFRQRGRLELSPAGHKFVEAAETVLNAVEEARSVAVSLAAGRLAAVRMAAPTTTLTDVLAPFLAELGTDAPLITVEEATYATAAAGLRTGVDLAIFTAPPPRSLDSRVVAVLPIWAHVNATHPLAAADGVAVSDLAEYQVITLDRTARARQLLDETFIEHGIAVSGLIECRNPQVAQALAAAGRGVAVLSDDPRFDLRNLPIVTSRGRLTVTLHAGWDRRHHASDELAAIAHRLADYCARRYGTTDGGA